MASSNSAKIAQSTIEENYIATAEAANQAIWLRKVLTDLYLPQVCVTVIFVDNKSAISMAKNPAHHGPIIYNALYFQHCVVAVFSNFDIPASILKLYNFEMLFAYPYSKDDVQCSRLKELWLEEMFY
ncbi:hypothetical protein Sango_2704000 [Sesamum angolense]|uniref:Uncharacterized protein n=1 Tax=Sesamum angolense TaxID=2727404 RepID=A0AAE1W2U5_9LAMI|nr:hypothetical protein Sango_2704000 [Sesamum angolense]